MSQRIRRILAAVKDPGAAVLPGVTKATQLAQACGAELELFHAIDAAVYVDMLGSNVSALRQLESEERNNYLQRLERVAARARRHARSVTVTAEWDYPSYEAIVRRALEGGADLLVAECHVGSHFAQGVLRLADWELLRLSPIPVLLVKNARAYRRPAVVGAVDPSHAFGKSTTLDEEILRLGAQLSGALHGTLHAAHAYQAAQLATPSLAAAGTVVAEPNAVSAQIGLESLITRVGVPVAARHLLGGDPRQVLEDLARRLRANILVVGSMSRSGLKRALIGNTAEWLLRYLPCDLLVVKPPEFVNRVPRSQRAAWQVVAQPQG